MGLFLLSAKARNKLVFLPALGGAEPLSHGKAVSSQGRDERGDSIMEKVIFFAPLYERIIESYKAELYIKGWVNIRKSYNYIHR